MKGKILFDQGHGEDRLDALMDRLPDERFLYDVTEEPLTLDKLRQYTALVLPNLRCELQKSEMKGIVRYVKSGGGLLVTVNFSSAQDCSNFYDCWRITKDEYLDKTPLYSLFKGWFIYEIKPFLSIGVPSVGVSSRLENFALLSQGIFWENLSFQDINFGKIRPLSHPTTRGIDHLYPKEKRKDATVYFYQMPDDNEICTILRRNLNLLISSSTLLETIKETYPGSSKYYRFTLQTAKTFVNATNKKLSEEYGRIGVVNQLERGRVVGVCEGLFEDYFIEQDKEKNANLRLALNILDYISQPTLYELEKTEKPKERLPIVYYP